MKEYVEPKVELIMFDEDVYNYEVISGCNCFYDIRQNNMSYNGQVYECKAETGHASENPFGVSASAWYVG